MPSCLKTSDVPLQNPHDKHLIKRFRPAAKEIRRAYGDTRLLVFTDIYICVVKNPIASSVADILAAARRFTSD